MGFSNPAIHRIRQIKARVIAPDGADFSCLELTLTDQSGDEAEVEVYFNAPHEGRAFEYATAINGVVIETEKESDTDEN